MSTVDDADAPDGDVRRPVVLLADSSDDTRDLGHRWLSSAGFAVDQAADGFEALAKLVKRRPALVIADALMPRLDGYQMCALMRSNADYRHIPVIMMAGSGADADSARSQWVGVNAHMAKPLTQTTLTTLVRELALAPELDQ